MNNKYDLGPKVSFTVVPLTDPVQQLGPEIAGLLAANAYRGEDEGATMTFEEIWADVSTWPEFKGVEVSALKRVAGYMWEIAIAAERLRCAKIAETCGMAVADPQFVNEATIACGNRIANKIRRGRR